MTELVTYIFEALGAPPAGLESLQYVVAAVILVTLCNSAIAMISGIFRWIGGN